MPKIVICVVPGWAAGGGHSLHVVADLTLASREHARFKQTDADVGSFDGGYGSAYLAKMVGQKFAREIFFLGRDIDAQRAYEMGMVNAVVPHAELEATAWEWAQEILAKSPTVSGTLTPHRHGPPGCGDGLQPTTRRIPGSTCSDSARRSSATRMFICATSVCSAPRACARAPSPCCSASNSMWCWRWA